MKKELKVAIMQPYFLPYIGYWQLFNIVDIFVIYDDIKYTKKGWINRNRFLNNKKYEYFTIPIKNDSDSLNIVDRVISDDFERDKEKLFRKFESTYKKAPYYHEGMGVLIDVFSFPDKNLFNFIFNSINTIGVNLGINSNLIISSSLNIDNNLIGKYRVIEICKSLNATQYINPIGGVKLYDKQCFYEEGIKLYFQKVNEICYPQLNDNFVPYLSIIDVIMYNGIEGAKEFLSYMEKI